MNPETPADGTWVDPELEREREFAAHLDAATPAWHVTTFLIAANVLVFIAMVANGVSATAPSPDALLRWGANYGPLTAGGQWWRLLTSAFVHIGLFHLVMNMLVLYTGGRLTERLFGQPAFVTLYGLSALGGSIVSVTTHPLTPSAGASGAIFGVYGGVIAFLVVRRASLPIDVRSSLMQNAILFVGYNILYGLTQAHVDMAAHIGGLVTGLIAGAILAPPLGAAALQGRWKRAAAVALAGIVVSAMAARRVQRFDDWTGALAQWAEVSKRVDAQYEDGLAKVGKKSLAPEKFADQIEQSLLPEITRLRQRFVALRLPPVERARADKMVTMLSLRAESLQLMAKGERSGDPAIFEQAEIKFEESLAASLAVAPNEALRQQLRATAKEREQQRAFAAEVDRLAEVDRNTVAAYRIALDRVRANRLTADAFAASIERDILKPWTEERDRFAAFPVSERQKAAQERLVTYISLRAEGWQLIATGARTNDAAKMRLGNEKHAEAAKLLAPAQPEPHPAPSGRGTTAPGR